MLVDKSRILNTTQNWVVSEAFRSIAHQTCTWRKYVTMDTKLVEDKDKPGTGVMYVFVGLYNDCIQKRPEKKDFIEQDVSPSRASSAKQRTGWGGKELHTGTETTRHRCPGAGYGKTGKGEVEEVKGSD